MKVLFLSHYKNNDKSGFYAQGLILAMHKVGIEITFRHITNNKKELDRLNPILSAINTGDLKDCTHCVQFLDPEYIVGTKKFIKNISIVLDAQKLCNDLIFMDEVWVFEERVKSSILDKHPKTKVRIIDPVLTDEKDKLTFMYTNNRKIEFEDFSLDSVGTQIKEALSA